MADNVTLQILGNLKIDPKSLENARNQLQMSVKGALAPQGAPSSTAGEKQRKKKEVSEQKLSNKRMGQLIEQLREGSTGRQDVGFKKSALRGELKQVKGFRKARFDVPVFERLIEDVSKGLGLDKAKTIGYKRTLNADIEDLVAIFHEPTADKLKRRKTLKERRELNEQRKKYVSDSLKFLRQERGMRNRLRGAGIGFLGPSKAGAALGAAGGGRVGAAGVLPTGPQEPGEKGKGLLALLPDALMKAFKWGSGAMLMGGMYGYNLRTQAQRAVQPMAGITGPNAMGNLEPMGQLGFGTGETMQRRMQAARTRRMMPGQSPELMPSRAGMTFGVDFGTILQSLGVIARTAEGQMPSQQKKALIDIYKAGTIAGYKGIKMQEYFSSINQLLVAQRQMSLGKGKAGDMTRFMNVFAGAGLDPDLAGKMVQGVQNMVMGNLRNPVFLRTAGGFGAPGKGFIQTQRSLYKAASGDTQELEKMFTRIRGSTMNRSNAWMYFQNMSPNLTPPQLDVLTEAVFTGEFEGVKEILKESMDTDVTLLSDISKKLPSLTSIADFQISMLTSSSAIESGINSIRKSASAIARNISAEFGSPKKVANNIVSQVNALAGMNPREARFSARMLQSTGGMSSVDRLWKKTEKAAEAKLFAEGGGSEFGRFSHRMRLPMPGTQMSEAQQEFFQAFELHLINGLERGFDNIPPLKTTLDGDIPSIKGKQ